MNRDNINLSRIEIAIEVEGVFITIRALNGGDIQYADMVSATRDGGYAYGNTAGAPDTCSVVVSDLSVAVYNQLISIWQDQLKGIRRTHAFAHKRFYSNGDVAKYELTTYKHFVLTSMPVKSGDFGAEPNYTINFEMQGWLNSEMITL